MAAVSSRRVVNLIRLLILAFPAWVHAGSILNEATTHLSVAILVSQCDRKECLTSDKTAEFAAFQAFPYVHHVLLMSRSELRFTASPNPAPARAPCSPASEPHDYANTVVLRLPVK